MDHVGCPSGLPLRRSAERRRTVGRGRMFHVEHSGLGRLGAVWGLWRCAARILVPHLGNLLCRRPSSYLSNDIPPGCVVDALWRTRAGSRLTLWLDPPPAPPGRGGFSTFGREVPVHRGDGSGRDACLMFRATGFGPVAQHAIVGAMQVF